MPWTQQFTDNFTRVNGAVGNGWTDAATAWAISANTLTSTSTAFGTSLLSRPTAESLTDQRVTATLTSDGTDTPLLWVRCDPVNHSGYVCWLGNGGFNAGKLAAGAFSPATSSSGTAVSGYYNTACPHNAGVDYVLDLSVTGTTVTATVATASNPSAILATITLTDSAYASGQQAISPLTSPNTAKSFTSYSASTPATTYTLGAAPASVATGGTVTATVTPDGTFTGTITITPTGTASTGLAAATLTYSSESTAKTATFTPTAAGTLTLSATNNGTLANPAAAAVTVTTAAAAPTGPNAPLGSAPLFPGSAWYDDVSAMPALADSTARMGRYSGTALYFEFGFTTAAGNVQGMPYCVVDGSTPLVAVSCSDAYHTSDSDLGKAPRPSTEAVVLSARIPASPPVEQASDGHLLIYDLSDHSVTEYYMFRTNADGTYSANLGRRWDATIDYVGQPQEGLSSADAAGLPVLPGVMRHEEVAAGVINHAIRMTLGDGGARGGWYKLPALATVNDYTRDYDGTIPMGARVRLKASYDISGYSAAMQIILTALKTYGAIIADGGTGWSIQGDLDSRWPSLGLPTGATPVPVSALELVDDGHWAPLYDATAPATATTNTPFDVTLAYNAANQFKIGANPFVHLPAATGWTNAFTTGYTPTFHLDLDPTTMRSGTVTFTLPAGVWSIGWNRNVTGRRPADPITVTVADATPTPSPLTAPVVSLVSSDATGNQLSRTDSTGGTAPITYQWQRGTAGTFTDLVGETGATLLDATATPGTLYSYRVVATDAAAATATSNVVDAQVPLTTPASTTTTLYEAVNNFGTRLSADHVADSGTIVLEAGGGAALGTLSTDRKLLVTVFDDAAIDSFGRVLDVSRARIFEVSGRTADTLTVNVVGGAADRGFAAGSPVFGLITAEHVNAIVAAIRQAQADILAFQSGGTTLPTQTGHAGAFLATDGTAASWSAVAVANVGGLQAALDAKAAAADLSSHVTNTTNPHGVTAAQVGAYAASQVDTLLAAKQDTGTAVLLAGSYADPAWITSLAGSKITGNITGNAASITGAIAESQVTGLAADLAARAALAADQTFTGTCTFSKTVTTFVPAGLNITGGSVYASNNSRWPFAFNDVNGASRSLIGLSNDGSVDTLLNLTTIATSRFRFVKGGATNQTIADLDSNGTFTLTLQAATARGLVVKAAASQSANLTEWRDSTGAVLASITAAGVFTGDGSGLTGIKSRQTLRFALAMGVDAAADQVTSNWLYAPDAHTLASAAVVAAVAPTGQPLIVSIEKSLDAGATWTGLWATATANRPTVAASGHVGTTTAFDSAAGSAGTLYRARVVQAGSTVAGRNVTVQLEITR